MTKAWQCLSTPLYLDFPSTTNTVHIPTMLLNFTTWTARPRVGFKVLEQNKHASPAIVAKIMAQRVAVALFVLISFYLVNGKRLRWDERGGVLAAICMTLT